MLRCCDDVIVDAASHPLDGPRGKLVRAVQQASLLEAHSEAYAAAHPRRFTCRFEKDAHYAYVEGRLPPLYLGLILGKVIHDLRSALDQLAWQLALSHVGEEVLADPESGTSSRSQSPHLRRGSRTTELTNTSRAQRSS